LTQITPPLTIAIIRHPLNKETRFLIVCGFGEDSVRRSDRNALAHISAIMTLTEKVTIGLDAPCLPRPKRGYQKKTRTPSGRHAISSLQCDTVHDGYYKVAEERARLARGIVATLTTDISA
jgi:hypothetical protein